MKNRASNSIIQPMWVAPGIPDVRDCASTYCETPLENLPILNVPDDLTWLTPLHPTIEEKMSPFRPELHDRQRRALNAGTLIAQANAQDVKLPKAFAELIQSEILQDRFPSWTACYFSVADKLVEAPFGLSGHLVPFLNDQQSCVVWYLLIPKDGTPYVLASYPVEDSDVGVYFLNTLDDKKPGLLERALEATRIVALSFSEFLYRYWLENNICFKNVHHIELTPKEKDFLADLKNC